ncbi:hypothetical protein NKH75_29615 [Mesorhizobium sp. M0984]|uniref:hypothetical protein n=1 Tax=Mesorhizobium sp. M0984 TaxID=2957041 RepID=UPI00333A4BFD
MWTTTDQKQTDKHSRQSPHLAEILVGFLSLVTLLGFLLSGYLAGQGTGVGRDVLTLNDYVPPKVKNTDSVENYLYSPKALEYTRIFTQPFPESSLRSAAFLLSGWVILLAIFIVIRSYLWHRTDIFYAEAIRRLGYLRRLISFSRKDPSMAKPKSNATASEPVRGDDYVRSLLYPELPVLTNRNADEQLRRLGLIDRNGKPIDPDIDILLQHSDPR